MSIRNKRLKKELLKEPLIHEICINDNWENDEIVTLTNIKNNIIIKLDERYPFSYPKLYVYKNNVAINYIDWFLIDKKQYTNIVNELGITIDCICCSTMTCKWSPISGIKDIIYEYDTHYNKYYKLSQFIVIYNKIPNFDNLIYKNILDFLY